jgi:uncharacterized damage-inducible protein DinB
MLPALTAVNRLPGPGERAILPAMRNILRSFTITATLLTVATPLAAQTPQGVMADLLRDVTQVEQKVVGLAKAIPATGYEWRPGKGVRSTGEVFMHIASDNYFMPVILGTAAPVDTGITKEYSTAEAFEKRTMNRDAIIAELEKSFAFLKAAMTAAPEATLNTPMGTQKQSPRALWIATATHLHEHLGQLIAYARSNNVVPPWSK